MTASGRESPVASGWSRPKADAEYFRGAKVSGRRNEEGYKGY